MAAVREQNIFVLPMEHRSKKRGKRISRVFNREELTPMEIKVACLAVSGASNKDIGRDLDITLDTVKSHVHNILVKLRISRRGQISGAFSVPTLKKEEVLKLSDVIARIDKLENLLNTCIDRMENILKE